MIPLHTTTIAVLSPPQAEEGEWPDPYDEQPAREESASGVRAHISSPAGSEQIIGGEQEVVMFRLSCDPVTLTHRDWVEDEQTGDVYQVVWVMQRKGLGLDHVEAGLRTVRGEA